MAEAETKSGFRKKNTVLMSFEEEEVPIQKRPLVSAASKPMISEEQL